MSDQEIVDAIFEIRVRNNRPWKALMEIALEAEPFLTKEILREIDENDRAISALMGKLAK